MILILFLDKENVNQREKIEKHQMQLVFYRVKEIKNQNF